MVQRYFVEQPVATEVVSLGADQARHLSQVMRGQVGQRVTIFDGGGDEFEAEVTSLSRNAVQLRIVERLSVDREAVTTVELGVALPKGERQRWLIEKVVELGVRRLIPLRSQRGVAQPVPAALQRLRRAVVEASKQCGRNRLMEIGDAVDAADFFAGAATDAERWLAHPGGACPRGPSLPGKTIQIAVGPEGGWTEAEVDAAVHAGWQNVGLGPRILRVETAALTLAALAIHAAC